MSGLIPGGARSHSPDRAWPVHVDPSHGLLHLEVPFEDLETHRAVEAIFPSSAAVDPTLSRVTLVFVLSPALQ